MATLLAIIDIWLEGLAVGWIESASLYIAVFLTVFLSAAATYCREKEFESLDFWKTESESIVRRNSQIIPTSKFSLVVGDILILKEGDIVPADCVLLSGTLTLNQDHFANSNSNNNLIRKEPHKEGHETDPFLISGSKIMRGSGEALVCAIGENSQIYGLPQLAAKPLPKPELQKKLENIADKIGLVGIYIALASFVSMVGNQIVTRLLSGEELFSGQAMKLYIEFLTVAVVIIVVAVPEGIPLALSIAWGNSLNQMQEQNIKVKNVNCKIALKMKLNNIKIGCEKLAQCNNICVDKTAGLTENKMDIRECYVEGEYFQNIEDSNMSPETKGLIGEGICVNTTAHIIEDPEAPEKVKKVRYF